MPDLAYDDDGFADLIDEYDAVGFPPPRRDFDPSLHCVVCHPQPCFASCPGF